eukprot:UN21282
MNLLLLYLWCVFLCIVFLYLSFYTNVPLLNRKMFRYVNNAVLWISNNGYMLYLLHSSTFRLMFCPTADLDKKGKNS